jgi:hypothetical protein
LKPARTGHPVARQPADLLCDIWLHGRDSVVVVRLDPHDARGLCRPKPDGKHRSERDRHLAEDVARAALAHNALDPVDELDHLDATLEHREESARAALVHRILAWHEADVGRGPREPFAVGRVQSREDRDPTDVVRRHHVRWRVTLPVVGARRPIAGTPDRAEERSGSVRRNTGQRYCVASVPARGSARAALRLSVRQSLCATSPIRQLHRVPCPRSSAPASAPSLAAGGPSCA